MADINMKEDLRQKEEERQIGSSIDPDGSDADSREEIEESLKDSSLDGKKEAHGHPGTSPPSSERKS